MPTCIPKCIKYVHFIQSLFIHYNSICMQLRSVNILNSKTYEKLIEYYFFLNIKLPEQLLYLIELIKIVESVR